MLRHESNGVACFSEPEPKPKARGHSTLFCLVSVFAAHVREEHDCAQCA